MIKQSAALKPGTYIGDLQINSVLGVGSFGITYLVTDPAIGTRFALKEYLPSEYVSRDNNDKISPKSGQSKQVFESGLKQFLNEARIVAALDHPNVVKVLRYFEANGTAYFLMPYYQGQPLQNLLESGGAFNREDAKALMLPLMDALEYIHEQAVVHQDISPANIYMTQNGSPVLLDFGVAAKVESDIPTVGHIGSAGYRAPEQERDEGIIGPWTDIYGLAATLYRCVSGRVPVSASDRQEQIAAGKNDPLTAFSELAPSGLFGGLTDAVELGLKLVPIERPADVGQWKKSFESLDWHRSVVVGGSTDSYAKEQKEWLPTVLLAIFVVTMVAIGVFLLTDQSSEPVSGTTTETTVTSSTEDLPRAEPAAAVPEPTSVERERWEAALEADTLLGYRRFIEDFPQSIYRTQAGVQIAILDEKAWQELAAENTIPAYEHYLEIFPDGIHQAEALQRIDIITQIEAKIERMKLERDRQENLAWEVASNKRSIAAFDQYIEQWPAGAHIEEATRIRRLLQDQSNDDKAFQTALNLNAREAFQAYIDAFPKGVNVTSALQHMDDLTLRPGKTFRDCPDCPVMMVVPAAAYWQGSEDSSPLALGMEKPRRLVTIDEPFAVGVHEVTMAEWDLCFEDRGCTSKPGDNDWGRGDRPVMMVSWNDAEE
ncbi:MAG: protein kinase, partial [Gammaproteobacteria bacterium]|nr:protein kinase [Gammaproteobacteria bacterium]